LGAKPSDQASLFEWVAASEHTAKATLIDASGWRHCLDLEVNFLEYWEQVPDGTVQYFS
jgi:hypothetical protein